MFLKSHTELSASFPAVGVELLRCPASTLVQVAVDIQRGGHQLLVEAGLGAVAEELSRYPQIEIGEHVLTDRVASLPFRLWGDEGGRVLWSMECSLDAAWLGPNRTYLALAAQYELPFVQFGDAVDRALLHRVAETAARRFVETAAQRLID